MSLLFSPTDVGGAACTDNNKSESLLSSKIKSLFGMSLYLKSNYLHPLTEKEEEKHFGVGGHLIEDPKGEIC